MYKKIFSTSILNALTAAVNFLSSYLIVKTLSLDVFGEFAIFSSYLAFGGLIFAIIPSNYSIFKLQDDKKYKVTLLVFFLFACGLFLFFSVFINLVGFVSIDIISVYFFGISTYALGYFDIKYQALGLLKKYFSMLFIIATLKIITLGVFYYTNNLNNLSDLLMTMTLVQVLVIVFYAYEDRNEIKFILTNFDVFKKTLIYINENFSSFKPYYLNTFLKRIRENSIILLFSKFTSSDIIGLFSIFVKIASFVFGLSRSLEAFFMNRDNINEYRAVFYKKILYFSITLQILFLIIGISYLKIFVNQYFVIEILVPSFLVYPHVYFLLARSEMLSKYQNKEANVSELLYISIVLVSSLISYLLGYNTIYPILITFVLSTFGLQLFMIFSQNKKIKSHV